MEVYAHCLALLANNRISDTLQAIVAAQKDGIVFIRCNIGLNVYFATYFCDHLFPPFIHFLFPSFFFHLLLPFFTLTPHREKGATEKTVTENFGVARNAESENENKTSDGEIPDEFNSTRIGLSLQSQFASAISG